MIMPSYERPRTDTQRLALLQQAALAGQSGGAEGGVAGYLSPATLKRLNTFLTTYRTQLQQWQALDGQRRDARLACDEPLAQVEVQIRTLWSALRLQVRRRQQSAAIYTFYGLNQQGRRAHPKGRAPWLLLAQQIQAGDDAAMAAGYAGMLNRHQLDEAILALSATLTQLATLEQSYQQAYQTLQGTRTRADQLCKEVVSELRHALRNLDPPQRRQIMRSYGLTFRADTGEVLGPQPPAPAPTLPDPLEPVTPASAAEAATATHVAVNGHSDPTVYQPLAM